MKKINVVIVEDDPMVIEINRKVVESCFGYSVAGTVRTGDEALLMIEKLQPDLVILDIFMPQMNGLEFLKVMRHKDLDMDVIMVTASQDADHLKEGRRYGVIDYIIKPFRLNRLKASLEKYRQNVRTMYEKDMVSQADIDLLVADSSETGNLPKGMSVYTLNKVKESILGLEEWSAADEIADRNGLARVTTRRYLEYLVEIGEMKVSLEYGSIGRPVKKYMLK